MRTMLTKNCEWCGVEFTQERKRKPRFCGRHCAKLWQNRDQPGSQAFRAERKCECCGGLVKSLVAAARFCGSECARLGRRRAVFGEEARRERSERMKALNARPDVQAKLIAFRASDRCPIRRPENIQKVVEKQRALGFPNLKYDGGPTVPQKLLFEALPGATMEFSISGDGKGRKNLLSLDIAIPSLKLAIEVDGLSHTKRKERATDARKEQILKERGWILLRFWNKEVMGDLSAVLMRIHATVAMLQKPERITSHGSVA